VSNKRGQPKTFTEQEFKDFVFEYMDFIYDKQENSLKDTPTFYGFYRFVRERKECSYHTIRRCFDEYWADIKKEFEDIRADLLSRGASIGIYNPTMTIFALKNWCNWKDKAEIEQDNTGVLETLVKIRECAIENNRNNRD
jgi:hypothetical protein